MNTGFPHRGGLQAAAAMRMLRPDEISGDRGNRPKIPPLLSPQRYYIHAFVRLDISTFKENPMSSTMEVGKKLVDLCKQGKHMEAITSLYAQNIASIEAMSAGNMPRRMDGLAAVKGKAEWWEANHEIHGGTVEGPWPHDDRFVVRFTYDVTAKSGPMAGQRMKLDEAALYTVKDGKVVQEEFFYHMGG
jgi:hypothetical protein